jgi:hypothetical protein
MLFSLYVKESDLAGLFYKRLEAERKNHEPVVLADAGYKFLKDLSEHSRPTDVSYTSEPVPNRGPKEKISMVVGCWKVTIETVCKENGTPV